MFITGQFDRGAKIMELVVREMVEGLEFGVGGCLFIIAASFVETANNILVKAGKCENGER